MSEHVCSAGCGRPAVTGRPYMCAVGAARQKQKCHGQCIFDCHTKKHKFIGPDMGGAPFDCPLCGNHGKHHMVRSASVEEIQNWNAHGRVISKPVAIQPALVNPNVVPPAWIVYRL